MWWWKEVVVGGCGGCKTAGYGAGVWAWVGGKRPSHHPRWAWVSAWPLGHGFQAGRGAVWPS
ncbi:hypothetical protein HanIR_Chr05g0212401 [Helianthus annuus]|nr:hypothetical protein HanIR_Chr05g0212401 [Helianthus annuus]